VHQLSVNSYLRLLTIKPLTLILFYMSFGFIKRMYVINLTEEGRKVRSIFDDLIEGHKKIALPRTGNYSLKACHAYVQSFHVKTSELEKYLPDDINQTLFNLKFFCIRNCRYGKITHKSLFEKTALLTSVFQKGKEGCSYFQPQLEELKEDAINYLSK